MNGRSPSRAVLLEMQDEHRAMREGHAFLDEKCLLLAGEMLRQLAAHGRLARQFAQAHEAALDALQSALSRHGLHELQVQPPAAAAQAAAALRLERSSLMGVALQQARWEAAAPGVGAAGRAADIAANTVPEASASAAAGITVPRAVVPSPEVEACRRAFGALLALAAPLAAAVGNLERLSGEYRRSVRRARALQDVLLPELGQALRDVESALEELEQQDLVAMRRPAALRAAAGR